MAGSRTILFSVSLACATLLASCGGGGDDEEDPRTRADPASQKYFECGNTPNYTADLVADRGGLLRWRTFPIRVFADVSNPPPRIVGTNLPEVYLRAMKSGAVVWQDTLRNGVASVIFVNSFAEADVTIRFQPLDPSLPLIAQAIRGPIGTNPKYQNKGAIIALNTNVFNIPINFGAAEENQLRNIVAHEMGHHLFALGHSTNGSDLMAVGQDSFTITARDLNTLRESYCRP